MEFGSFARLTAQRSLSLHREVLRYTEIFGWRRGLTLLYESRYRSAPPLIELAWPGFVHPFRLRNCDADLRTFTHVIMNGNYEPPSVRAPKWIVDLGANIGLSSVWFAARFPDSRVLSVEPDAGNFELLVENTSGYFNVTAVRAAVWAHCGRVELADPGGGPDSYRVATPGVPVSAQQPSELVNALDVPTLMADHAIDRIDILKVDIEGSEREVFAASSDWIDRVDSVAIELHDRFKPGCSRAFFSALAGAFPNEMTRGEDLFVWRDTPANHLELC